MTGPIVERRRRWRRKTNNPTPTDAPTSMTGWDPIRHSNTIVKDGHVYIQGLGGELLDVTPIGGAQPQDPGIERPA